MQTFTDEQHYSHAVDRVLDCYTNPEFLQEKYAQLGREDIELRSHEVDGDKVRMVFAYSDKPDMELPGFARKLVPERAHVLQHVTWDRAARIGKIEVNAEGSPVHVHGEMRIAASGSGSVNTIRWEVSCTVPLVGGKLEKLICDGLRHKAAKDREVTEVLAGDPRWG